MKILITILLASSFSAYGQINIDSLSTLVENKKTDKYSRLSAALELSNYYRFNSPNKGISTSRIAESLSKEISNDTLLAKAWHYLASSYYQISIYDSSETYNEKALALRRKLGNDLETGASLINLGQLYADRSKPEEALKLLHEAEKIYEKENLTFFLGIIYNSLGNLYYTQKIYNYAYDYFHKAIKKYKELQNSFMLVSTYNNLAHVYYEINLQDSSKYYYHLATDEAKTTGDISLRIQTLNNLSSYYIDKEEYMAAYPYLKESISLGEGSEFEGLLANAYANMAIVLSKGMGKQKQALEYALKGLEMNEKYEMPELIYNTMLNVAKIYYQLGDYKNAYLYIDNAFLMKDSAIQVSVHEQLADMEAKYENEKKVLEIKNLEIEKKANEAEIAEQSQRIEKENQQKIFFAIGFGLMAVLAIIIFRSYRQKRKSANILAEKNRIITLQKEEVEKQKHIVEEKNAEILDSITYAKRIQTAILPPTRLVKEWLPNSFVLYKPKDIVAGDFYWMENIGETIIYAAADCTGHGVPGAMVSVVCHNAMNRSVREFGLREPGEILDKTRELVLRTFEKSEEEVKDGMDIALCSLTGNILKYAGANNPLWLIRNGELIETKANKQAIGKVDDPLPFTTHTFELKTNDTFYTFSDGYADQFGGENGKKFKAKAFKELLLSIQNETITNQRNIINEVFEKWKGQLEQVDDVCVIGVKI